VKIAVGKEYLAESNFARTRMWHPLIYAKQFLIGLNIRLLLYSYSILACKTRHFALFLKKKRTYLLM